MQSRDFCYWLQGYFEVTAKAPSPHGSISISADQIKCIQDHLNLVFAHEIDPSMGNKPHQDALNHFHNSGGPNGNGLVARC